MQRELNLVIEWQEARLIAWAARAECLEVALNGVFELRIVEFKTMYLML
jgi:hypothetical protein